MALAGEGTVCRLRNVGISDQLQTGDRNKLREEIYLYFAPKFPFPGPDQQCPEGMVFREVQYGTAL